MKHKLHNTLFIPLIFLLIISFHTTTRASRPLTPPQLGTEVGHEGTVDMEDTWNLMGLEECEHGDEECAKRRVISEAHLDYIYTQRHGNP